MIRTVTLYADAGVALAEHANIFISVWIETPTLPRLREMRGHLERARKQWPGANCGMTVMGPGSIELDVPKEIRDASTAISREHPSVGNTVIVETTGFAGSALRAFLSGIFLVARTRGKIHSSIEEGAAWLTPIASTAAKMEITAASLVAATNDARAATVRR
jgi:hypothetical protein